MRIKAGSNWINASSGDASINGSASNWISEENTEMAECTCGCAAPNRNNLDTSVASFATNENE